MHQPLRTLTANLSSHLEDIPGSALPRVFQDALTVVRALGLSYIWIDSLCIVQDDRDDWARESRMMGRVYEQATLTISATACENGMVPFLGPEAQSELRNWARSERGGLPVDLRNIRARRIPDVTKYEGPIMSRAWTLQERFFSTRTIHFTQYQVQWACKEVHACESNTSIFKQSTVKSTRKALNRWNSLVHEYSALALTKFSDKLPAISGLAAHFQPEINSTYVAGLWELHLPEQLAWMMSIREVDDQDLRQEEAANLETSRPPSWTWASIAGVVRTWVPTVERSHLSVQRIVCQPDASNIYGEVQSGACLHIKCSLVDAEVLFRPDEKLASFKYHIRVPGKHLSDNEWVQRMDPDCKLVAQKIDADEQYIWVGRRTGSIQDDAKHGLWPAKVVLMPLVSERGSSPCCLVLGKQPDFGGRVYQRVGFLDMMDEERWQRPKAQIRPCEVTLV